MALRDGEFAPGGGQLQDGISRDARQDGAVERRRRQLSAMQASSIRVPSIPR